MKRAAPTLSAAQAAAFGAYLQGVRRATRAQGASTRVFEASLGANETVAEDGGFLVGGDIGSTLLASAYGGSQIAHLAQHFTMSNGPEGKLYKLKDHDRATGFRWGGVVVHHVPEGEPIPTPSRPKFEVQGLRLRKMVGLCYASNELVADASLLGGIIGSAFAAEIGFQLDGIMFEGAGGATGLGFLHGPGKISIAKEDSQTAATIVKPNLAKMAARLPASSYATAEWWVSTSALPAIAEWRAENGTLMQLPVRPLEHCNPLGTEGDIVLADPAAYAIVDRGAIEATPSIHVAFLTDEQAFRFVYRYDAQPLDSAPITPFKGTDTQSRFITLATRA